MDNSKEEVLITGTAAAAAAAASLLPIGMSMSRSFDSQDRKEQRRHKRRKLTRYIKKQKTKGFPSFVDMLAIDYDEATSSESEQEKEDVGLDKGQRPKLVRIDVDVHLGLARPSPEKSQAARVPGATSSLSSTAISTTTTTTTTTYNIIDTAANPVDEGWYEGSVTMLMTPDDAQYLSDLQQLIRANLELFSATQFDAAISQAGRRTPTVRGKVGVRCRHCAKVATEGLSLLSAKKDGPDEIASASSHSSSSLYNGKQIWPAGAISYPVNIAGLHSVCSQKPQLHFEQCPNLPWETRAQFKNLTQGGGTGTPRRTRRSEGGIPTSLYYAITAKRIGLVDVKDGIRFGRDLALEPLPFEAIKAQMESEMQLTMRSSSSFHTSKITAEPRMTADEESERVLAEALTEGDDPSKFPARSADKSLVTDYFFLAIRQMAICHVVPSDFSTRGKKTKLMRLGYAGFCCRHCMEPDGAPPYITDFSCRSFSSAADNLSSAISNSFISHLQKCYKTPIRIKKALTAYKRIHQRQMAQLAYGSQRRLIHELWARLRAADLPEDAQESAVATEGPQDDLELEPATMAAAHDANTNITKDEDSSSASSRAPEHPATADDPPEPGPESSTLTAAAHENDDKNILKDEDSSSSGAQEHAAATDDPPEPGPESSTLTAAHDANKKFPKDEDSSSLRAQEHAATANDPPKPGPEPSTLTAAHENDDKNVPQDEDSSSSRAQEHAAAAEDPPEPGPESSTLTGAHDANKKIPKDEDSSSSSRAQEHAAAAAADDPPEPGPESSTLTAAAHENDDKIVLNDHLPDASRP
jgi:hypothetical protein